MKPTIIPLRESEKLFDSLTAEEAKRDFIEKNTVLASHYKQIPALSFYEEFLFHDMDESQYLPSIVICAKQRRDDDEEFEEVTRTRHAVHIDELIDFCWRDDVAVNPCGYYDNYPVKVLMREVYAFAMDIDKVRPDNLRRLIENLEAGNFPMPTSITNSGGGIHFFYILDKALQVGQTANYIQNTKIAEEIYYRLHDRLKVIFNGVQKHHLGQDYRIVGSLTKYGQITTAWESGSFWRVEDLAKSLGVDTSQLHQPMRKTSAKMRLYAENIAKDLGIEPPAMDDPKVVYSFIADNKDAAYQERQKKNAKKQERAAKRAKKIKKSDVQDAQIYDFYNRGWYPTTWGNVYTKTKPGNRYRALMGLAIVAYKAQIPEEQFAEDLDRLSVLWQTQDWEGGDRFNPHNVKAIMNFYRNGAKYENISSETLEEWFGWKFRRKTKGRREPLPQYEHLEYARFRKMQKKRKGELKNSEGRPSAQSIVVEWRATNPGKRKADCNRETGLDPKTIRKWWDTVIADTKNE